MSDDLKPCPFCGAVPLPVNTNGSYVFCSECGADGPVHLTKAVAAWNTRAIDPAAIREAALREAAEVRITHSKGYEFIPTRFRDAILALIGEK